MSEWTEDRQADYIYISYINGQYKQMYSLIKSYGLLKLTNKLEQNGTSEIDILSIVKIYLKLDESK